MTAPHRLGLTLGVTLMILAPLRASAQLDWPEYDISSAVSARHSELVERLDESADGPLGLAAIDALLDFAEWAPLPLSGAALEDVIARPDTHFMVRERARYERARALFAHGDHEQAEGLMRDAGYLVDWSIIGPFANDGMAGFDTAYGPEQERRSEAVYPGKVIDVGWRDITGIPRLGYVELDVLSRPARSAVTYAATVVESPRRQQADLWMGADGAYKVWLNGELVGTEEDLGGGPVREVWGVTLRRGRNELVVKVAVDAGPMGFFAHLTDADGAPVVLHADAALSGDTRALTTPAQGPAPRHAVWAEVALALEPTQLQLLEGSVDVDQRVSLASAAYLMSRVQPRDPQEPWRGFLDPGLCDGPRAALLCAEVLEQPWQRRLVIERAAEATEPTGGDWLWLALRLADLKARAEGVDADVEALQLLDRILHIDADFVPARLMVNEILDRNRLRATARVGLISLLAASPDSPRLVYETRQALASGGRHTELLALFEREVAIELNKGPALVDWATVLAQAGRPVEALDVLRQAATLYPSSLIVWSLRAEMLAGLGRDDEAEAAHLRALELSPGDSDAWERLGRFYLRLGQPADAQEAFVRALEISPQNTDLAAQLDLLVEDEPFYEPFTMSPIEVAALSVESAEERDFVILLDQTITNIHSNGLFERFVQRSFRVQTRPGVEDVRYFGIQYTPQEERVQIVHARIIKPDGRVLESFDRRERSLSQPSAGLYYDLRELVLVFEDLQPGDVLDVAYTQAAVSRHNMFDDYFGEFWFAQDTQPIAVARYGLLYPSEMTLQIRAPRRPFEERQESTEDGELVVFELHDVPHIEVEPDMPGFSSVADHIHVSTFATWNGVADWYWNLVRDQLVVSPEIVDTVEALTAGLTSTRDRVQAIHEYVVRNTRYVGIEFGIQGYRPHRTTVSFERRFGDCKDTASLMKVMLAVADIDSNIVLVRTRNLGGLEQSPASLAVFNHAITYVPELDLYMDGTAGHSGLDELPYLDQGAAMLIVRDGGGGTFLTSPIGESEANTLTSVLDVDLGSDGQPAAAEITARGQFAPPLRRTYEAGAHRREDFQRDLRSEYPGAQITDLEFAGLDDIKQAVTIRVGFDGVSWLEEAGGGWELRMLGSDSRMAAGVAGSAERRQPIDLAFPFRRSYQHTYRLPPNIRLAEPVSEAFSEDRFGSFDLVAEGDDSHVAVRITLSLTAQRVTPDDYPAFRAFVERIDRVLSRPLRLVETTDG